MQIWKFSLAVARDQHVVMPEGAEILSVGNQRGSLVMWAMVDPEARQRYRRIMIVGTGHTFCCDATFVGTVQLGEFVWHVFAYEGL